MPASPAHWHMLCRFGLKVFAKRLVTEDAVCILGDCHQLGNNDFSKAILLIDT